MKTPSRIQGSQPVSSYPTQQIQFGFSVILSSLQANINDMDVKNLVFQVLNLGTDNTVCRHGIHGLYRLYSVDISSSLLVKGDNSIFLTQARAGDALCGVLYDYLRLEAPANS